MQYELLETIQSPDDVKTLDDAQLEKLCVEIRHFLIETVSKNGGHLASNLGVVELTVALHRVFESPRDKIIFDVGHQCYTHKLLTGRREAFETLRKEDGLSGFMRPSESEHDPFVTGHSSNAVSAAYGICKGNMLDGKKTSVIAVVGDGAMTGGMVYEAMNNAGREKNNLILILNDNQVSISKNVGAFARYLSLIRAKPSYHRFKHAVERGVSRVPFIGKRLRLSLLHSKTAFKNALYKSNLFETFGFNYMGPVDGHNLKQLTNILQIAKDQARPALIHVVTTKGKGYAFAESKPTDYHGVPAFDARNGMDKGVQSTFSSAFGKYLCSLAERDASICAVTAAMTDGTGLGAFRQAYRERFFDVGIAEQHAVTFCGGLAKAGKKPFFAVYSTFLQRGYDQVLHDLAIDDLPVTLCIDRAGIVGEDGVTHQGVYDVPYLTTIPNVTLYAPSCYDDLEVMLNLAARRRSGVYGIRYPRGGQPQLPAGYKASYAPVASYGPKDAAVAIVTYGVLFAQACRAAQALEEKGVLVRVFKLNRIFPLREEFIDLLCGFERIYFYEDCVQSGGIGEKVAALLLKKRYSGAYFATALPNAFIPQGRPDALYERYGLCTDGIIKQISGE